MSRWSLCPLLCSLLVAGCATPPAGKAPDPSATPPVAAAWQAAVPASGAPLVSERDWSRFGDPLLPGLIVAAQQASSSVSSAAARIAQARATRVAAAAALLPSLSGVASASQSRSIPRGPDTTSVSVGVQSAWEIDLFGAAAAGRDAASARLQGAQAALQDARLAVAAETASAYLALRACEALLEQAQLDAQSREQTSRLTELSAKAGFTAPADAALVRAGAAQSRSQAQAQRASCDTQLKSLVELTDIAEPTLRQRLAVATARVPQPEAFGLGEAALPAGLLTRRPDLAQAEREVLAAAGDRAQAAARQQPRVSLSGSFALGSGRSAGVTASGAVWSLGPLQIELPIFDGGVRAADAAAARAAYDSAVAQYRALVRRAVREVEASLVALQSGAEREADVLSAARDFEAALRATEARQKGGLASLLDLEIARRNAVTAQDTLINLRRERAAAWISLFRSLGGGWSADMLAADAGNVR